MKLEDFDRPIIFIFFLLLALTALQGILKAGFKAAGWTGPAALFGS